MSLNGRVTELDTVGRENSFKEGRWLGPMVLLTQTRGEDWNNMLGEKQVASLWTAREIVGVCDGLG